MIVEIGPPFKVRDVHGSILARPTTNHSPVHCLRSEISLERFALQRPTRPAISRFEAFSTGTFDFKTTKDGFQPLIGKIVLSTSTRRKALIQISMPIGIQSSTAVDNALPVKI